MLFILVQPHVVDQKVRRQRVAKALGDGALAGLLLAVEAVAGAAGRAGRGKAPRRRHGRV